MPDDVAKEKVALAEMLGATVERVRPASIVDEKQFVVGILPLASLPLDRFKLILPSLLSEPGSQKGSRIHSRTFIVCSTTTPANLGYRRQ